MNIHPLWFLCLTVRFSFIFLFGYLTDIKNNDNKTKHFLKNIGILFLFIIALGFLYRSLYGSNEEVQINKVFWHDSRLVHAVLYFLATYYMYNNNSKLVRLVLSLDVIFSIMYRTT